MGTPDRVGTTHTVQLLSAHCLMDKLSSAQRTRSFCPMRQHEHATPPPDKMPPRIKTLGPNSPNLVPSTDLQSPIPPSLLSYSEVSHPPPPPRPNLQPHTTVRLRSSQSFAQFCKRRTKLLVWGAIYRREAWGSESLALQRAKANAFRLRAQHSPLSLDRKMPFLGWRCGS